MALKTLHLVPVLYYFIDIDSHPATQFSTYWQTNITVEFGVLEYHIIDILTEFLYLSALELLPEYCFKITDFTWIYGTQKVGTKRDKKCPGIGSYEGTETSACKI